MTSRRSGSDAAHESPASPSKGTPQDKQARLLTHESGHFSLLRAYHLADFITLLNGLCGINSVLSSLRFCVAPDELSNIWLALSLVPLGMFFDFADGKVARLRGKQSLMGQELDSLADLVSFGVSPAACAFSIGLRTPIDHLILTFFVLCGLARLARFNVTVQFIPKDATGKSNYFEGLPIPTSLFLVGVMSYWVSKGYILENLPWGMALSGSMLEFHPVGLLFALHGCLLISKTLHIPKP